MATRIAFKGGDSILVTEELSDVVAALQDAMPGALPPFTRKAGYGDPGTIEGQPVHVRPGSVLYVTTT